MMEPVARGLGCDRSVLDGTERAAEWEPSRLPDSFSWEWCMPPVRDQGSTSTCVCQALTGNLDFFWNSLRGEAGVCNGFSIDLLYDQRLNKKTEGMQIKTALKYLRRSGMKTKDGQLVKIDNYALVKSPMNARHAILMNGPLAIGLPVYTGAGDEFWKKSGELAGGHCVAVVGYTPEGFTIRNSWGRSWGRGGYLEISEGDFVSSCFEAWTFTL